MSYGSRISLKYAAAYIRVICTPECQSIRNKIVNEMVTIARSRMVLVAFPIESFISENSFISTSHTTRTRLVQV
jgi:hypothetical protein